MKLQTPAQPNSATYGLEALHMAKRYAGPNAREEYRADHNGQQAPAYDPAKPIKRWAVDIEEGDRLFTWKVRPDGPRELEITMSKAEAAAINLPGLAVYAKWDPPKVKGYILNGDVKSDIGRESLCTYAEASALAADLRQAGWEALTPVEILIPNAVFDSSEDRRQWVIPLEGENLTAGTMLVERHSFGLGKNGRWCRKGENNATTPKWITADNVTGEGDNNTEVPVPMRSLLPNEEFRQTMFGWQIYRMDHAETIAIDVANNQPKMIAEILAAVRTMSGAPAAQSSGGGSSALVLAKLAKLEAKFDKLLAALEIKPE